MPSPTIFLQHTILQLTALHCQNYEIVYTRWRLRRHRNTMPEEMRENRHGFAGLLSSTPEKSDTRHKVGNKNAAMARCGWLVRYAIRSYFVSGVNFFTFLHLRQTVVLCQVTCAVTNLDYVLLARRVLHYLFINLTDLHWMESH